MDSADPRRARRQTHRPGIADNFKAEAMSDTWTKCDVGGCNAQAHVTTTLDTGLDLHWCGHHFTEHDEALWPYVIHTDDRRAKLMERAHVDA